MKLYITVILILSVYGICFSQTAQWRNLPNSPVYPNNRMEDIYFINANTGWAVFYAGKVFKTTNGGAKWDTLSPSGSAFRSIGFFDELNGILGTLSADSNLVLFKTTNGGTNFSAITNLPNPRIKGICGINILSNNVAYACGRYDTPARIIKTTDRGTTWSSFSIDTLIAKSLVDCYFWSSDSGYAVGERIYKYSRETVGISVISTQIPDRFILHQNYPNPFNPETIIGYSIVENSFVTLKVYDVLGNEVATLVNEKQNPGSYHYQFSNVDYQLASGIYFYELFAENFKDTKRMIMLK